MKITRVHHIGVVLADLKPLKEFFIRGFNLKVGSEEIYHGHEGDENLCFFPVGETEIELCSSVGNTGESARLVAQRGQHIEHIALEVEDIEEALRELKKKGVPLLQSEPMPGAKGSRVAFLDPRATGDILIELVESGSVELKRHP
jgi:methylmalonyl-CoA/ethylmalonyl-CoA epimerase